MARKKKTLEKIEDVEQVMARTGATAADVSVAMEILKPTEASISTADLQAAGIDMRLTKADILELISAQLRDQLHHQVQDAVHAEINAGIHYSTVFDAIARKTFKIIEVLEKEQGFSGVSAIVTKDHHREWYVFDWGTSDEELKRSAARLEFIAPARIVSKQMVANDPKKYSATAVEERAQYNCAGNLTGAPTRFAEPNCRLARFFKSEITGKWGQSEVMLSFGLDDKLLKNAELLAAWDEYSVARAQLKEIVRNYNNLDQVDRQARYALVNKILSASEPGKRVLSFFDGFRQGTMENVSKLLAAATGPQK